MLADPGHRSPWICTLDDTPHADLLLEACLDHRAAFLAHGNTDRCLQTIPDFVKHSEPAQHRPASDSGGRPAQGGPTSSWNYPTSWAVRKAVHQYGRRKPLSPSWDHRVLLHQVRLQMYIYFRSTFACDRHPRLRGFTIPEALQAEHRRIPNK